MGPSFSVLSRLLTYTLFFLAAFPAWVRGGTPPESQVPLVIYGVGAMVLSLLHCGTIRKWLHDPFAYVGFLFLVLLALQWWHAGRVQFFDPVSQVWTYTPPARSGWPSAFSRPEAAEMLRWFFPAWAAGLALRSGTLARPQIRHLFRLLALNGALIGALGIVQQQVGQSLFPFTRELGEVRFFAGFGYENHAASYFTLMAALAVGMAVYDLRQGGWGYRFGRGWLLALAAAINLTAAHCSLARAGMVLAWMLIGIGVMAFFAKVWGRLTLADRVRVGAGGMAALILLIMAIQVVGGPSLSREVESLGNKGQSLMGESRTGLDFDGRMTQIRSALRIWKDYPCYGVGGWGYRYLLPGTLSNEEWASFDARLGKANVHNDPVQFLVEFGGVGMALIAAAVIGLLVPACRKSSDGKRPAFSDAVIFFALAGAALVVIHSMIDLPFRSPAILLAWTLALAGAGALAGPRSSLPSPVTAPVSSHS